MPPAPPHTSHSSPSCRLRKVQYSKIHYCTNNKCHRRSEAVQGSVCLHPTTGGVSQHPGLYQGGQKRLQDQERDSETDASSDTESQTRHRDGEAETEHDRDRDSDLGKRTDQNRLHERQTTGSSAWSLKIVIIECVPVYTHQSSGFKKHRHAKNRYPYIIACR